MDEEGGTGGIYRGLNGTMTLLTLVVWLAHNEHEHEADHQVIDKSWRIKKADAGEGLPRQVNYLP